MEIVLLSPTKTSFKIGNKLVTSPVSMQHLGTV